MALELVRTRKVSANETKADGARLLAVEHTVRSKALQESYHAVLQVQASSTTTLPTVATNLASIRYLYLEVNDPVTLGIKNGNLGQADFQELFIAPLVVNGLATFECDIDATEVQITNTSAVSVRVHVFVAGDTL